MTDSIAELTAMLTELQSGVSDLITRTESLDREIHEDIIPMTTTIWERLGAGGSRSGSVRRSSMESVGSMRWLMVDSASSGMSKRWSSSSRSINFINQVPLWRGFSDNSFLVRLQRNNSRFKKATNKSHFFTAIKLRYRIKYNIRIRSHVIRP